MDSASVLYVNKGFAFPSQFKEFIVYPEIEVKRLAPYLEDALAFAEFRRTGKLPSRLLCNSTSDSYAKECHVVAPCFARSK